MNATIYVPVPDDNEHPTVIDRIEKWMFFDSEDRKKQSELLLAIYHEATPNEQAKINECFICICGYSMDSLLAQAAQDGKK